MSILLINGPNLNLLGKRETSIYGHTSLDELEKMLSSMAKEHNINLICFQSNSEHEIINKIHNAGDIDVQ